MGVVYEAESLTDGRVVALKLLLAGMDEDDARQRFLREGRVASTLMHPNTVYVFGTQEIDGLPTIAMEYVAGGTLEDLVREKRVISPVDAVRMVGQVIDGLEAAHAGGILHRDIKPSNCFIAQDGSVKVGDFGLSRPTQGGEDMRVTKTGMILGTPAYAPPEQLLGEPLDVRSDIYSVGATLYYLLTGVLPFPGANPMVVLASVLQGTPTPPETHQPAIPKALSAIVLRAMARQPSERFANYAEFRTALDAFTGVEDVPGRPVSRMLAFLVDILLASVIADQGIDLITGESSWSDNHPGWGMVLRWCVFLCVRAIPEARWGTSPGKRLFSLRTRRLDGARPSWFASLGRCSVIFLSGEVGSVLLKLIPAFGGKSESVGNTTDVVLPLLLLSTMRRSNGYAALHDRIFGTRVVRTRDRQRERRFARGATRVSEVPSSGERIGAFVLGAPVFTPTDGSVVYDAIDASLGRPVWLHRVTRDVPERTMVRRNLARPARMRWVAGRRDETQSFDVYGTPDGQRLIDLPAPVSWEVCRGWLEDLASEMVSAQEDGETPRPTVEQIWLAAGQQAIIMDFATVPRGEITATPHAGAILHAVARRALCGADASTLSPWPALPRSVRAWLDALPHEGDPAAVSASVVRVRDTAAQVTRAQRVRVAALTALLPAVITIGIVASGASKLYNQPVLRHSLGPMIEFATPGPTSEGEKADTNAARRTGLAVGRSFRRFREYLAPLSRDSAQHAKQHVNIDARRIIVTQYLATAQGAVLRDTSRRLALVGDSLPWAALDSVFRKLGTVSAADSTRARQIVEHEWHGTLPGRDTRLVEVIATSFRVPHVLLFITGMFVILFAVVMRRGPVMRNVALEVVDRAGQPATRLRLLARATGTWAVLVPLPTLFTFVVMYGVVYPRSAAETIPYPDFWYGVVSSGISLSLGGIVLLYGLRYPSRGLGDRIAGTTTVPE